MIEELSSSQDKSSPAPRKIEFRLVHRGQFEMIDHMQAPLPQNAPLPVRRPKELVVEMAFPQHASARGIDLDVNETTVRVSASGYEPLELSLPHPVVEAKGSARFDKRTRQLIVTLPVKPPTPPPQKRLEIQEESEEDTETEVTAPLEEKQSSDRKQDEVRPKSAMPEPEPKKEKKIASDAFSMLRETALMVANDPLYVRRDAPPSPPVTTTKLEQTLDDTIRQHVAGDSTFDDLPPLESCSEDEQEEEEEKEKAATSHATDNTSEGSTFSTPQPTTEKPSAPAFTVTETTTCRSYIIDVRDVDKSSVQLSFPSPRSFRVAFSDGSGGRYELSIADLAQPVDASRAECHVATENLVVILYRQAATSDGSDGEMMPQDAPPVGRFQNELLYELD
ncbi:hypothetical protein ATCC90586_001979 [Pythium insidiosum]|nr:hypothetical protein ATCC90586_001979 [Pythium insidiosum]